MHVVIDIPEEIYSRVELMDNEKMLPYNLRKAYLLIIICAITNGKILPKGHGDLIDRNEVMKNMEFEEDGYCDFDCYKPITDAQTIIKADKTESEIHCAFTEEIAKSFIEDVEAVKDFITNGRK